MAKNTQKVAYSTAAKFLGQFVTSGLGIISVGISTRYLGADFYGQLTAASIYLAIFQTMTDAGISSIAIREIAAGEREPQTIVGSILALRTFVALGVTLLAVTGSFLIYPHPNQAFIRQTILLLSIPLVLASVQTTLTAVLASRLRNDLIIIGDILGKIVTVGLIFLAASRNWGFQALVIAYLAGAVVNFLSDCFFGLRSCWPKVQIDTKYWRYILALSIPVGVAGIFNALYFKADGFLLSVFRSTAEVGLYGVAYKIVELTMAVPIFFMASIFPLMAAAHTDVVRIHGITTRAVRVMALLAAPVTAGVIVLSRPIAIMLGGPGFAGAALPMSVLMLGNYLIYVNAPYNSALLARNQQNKLVRVAAIGLLINVLLNIIAIPLYGVVGAATSVVITEIVLAMVVRRYYRDYIAPAPSNRVQLLPAVLAVIMAGAVYFCTLFFSGSSILIVLLSATLVGAAVYGGLGVAFGLIRPADVRELIGKG